MALARFQRMKRCLLVLICCWMGLPSTWAGEQKAILNVLPSLAELGPGWTTNQVAYLIDPLSQPSEIDYQSDPKTSGKLAGQREAMKTNGRTGCGMVYYGRGDLVMNSGLYRVTIQRWAEKRPLHNAWVTWKMNPSRVVRSCPAVGEDYFWVNEWWRETLLRHHLVFRRGLFHVLIEAGADSDVLQMVRLGEAIDRRIRQSAAANPKAISTGEKR
jgi:hypothetical protein